VHLIETLSVADLCPPARSDLTQQQVELADRIVKAAGAAGVAVSRQDIKPVVRSEGGAEFLRFASLPQIREDPVLLSHIVTIVPVLSRLQTALQAQRSIATLYANLTVGTLLHDSTNRESTSIEESISAAVRMVSAFFGGNIRIEWRTPKAKLPMVPSYTTSLRVVWINIIRNAIEATGGTGTVRVSLVRRKDYAVIRISDNGKGLPPDVEELLAGTSDQKVIVGYRFLGLQLVKRIVRAHGGCIKVVSTNREGTILEVLIPLKGVDHDHTSHASR
jgi:signal transduction histidine kinase